MDLTLGNANLTVIRALITYFEKRNLKAEQIVKYIASFDELERSDIHYVALISEKSQLADEIEKANKLIQARKVEQFKESVTNGTYEQFLSKMSSYDKYSLENYLINSIGLSPYEQPTKEEKQYLEIIASAINKDLEEEAKSKGFSSLEEMTEFNRKIGELIEKRKKIPKRSSKGTRFRGEIRGEKIKMVSPLVKPTPTETQVIDINGKRVRVKVNEQIARTIPEAKPIEEKTLTPNEIKFDVEKNLKEYIKSIRITLFAYKIDFKKWSLYYEIFKGLLTTTRLNLTDINKFAKSLLSSSVICTSEEEKAKLQREKSNLKILISHLNDPIEIRNREINRQNIAEVYKIITSLKTDEEEPKRKR